MSTIGSSALNIQLSKISASKLRRREARNGISGHGPWGAYKACNLLTAAGASLIAPTRRYQRRAGTCHQHRTERLPMTERNP
jgi:hypothetical protein